MEKNRIAINSEHELIYMYLVIFSTGILAHASFNNINLQILY